jgi:uncharacterized membrane protein YbhN (UPF0104 family)
MRHPFWKRIAQQTMSLLLAAGVLGVVFYKGPDLWNDLQKVGLPWTIGGLGCYCANYLLRAMRFRTISRNNLKLWPDAIHSASLHGFATYLMPFRTGDLTLPVILKSVSDTGFMEGGRILIKARLLDFSTLGFWILFAVLFFQVPIPFPIRVALFLVGIAMAATPFVLRILEKSRWLSSIDFFNRFAASGGVSYITWQEIFESSGIWIAVAACFYCAARAVGLPLGIAEVWLLITIQLPLQLIPLQGIANAGNHEGGWVAGLAILGIPASEALNFALTSHAILLLYVLSLGPIALISYKSRAGRKILTGQ